MVFSANSRMVIELFLPPRMTLSSNSSELNRRLHKFRKFFSIKLSKLFPFNLFNNLAKISKVFYFLMILPHVCKLSLVCVACACICQ